MPRIAIIGGSGMYDILDEIKRVERVSTPRGVSTVYIGYLGDEEVAFLPRHDRDHSIPPHMINYRSNIYALHSLGVERIYATNAVGSLREDIKPGTLRVVTNFIDFTKNRPTTFYDGQEVRLRDGRRIRGVVHVDMTMPVCPELTRILDEILLERYDYPRPPHVIYACMEGPRFETPAEINMLRILGADVVGMTLCPEIVLARELEMCYVSLAIVTNYAAGIQEKVSHREVIELFDRLRPEVIEILKEAVKRTPVERNCPCKDALKEYRIFP